MISFRSHGEELEKIISGELKQIEREIDRHNLVFKEIETMNRKLVSGYPYGMIYIKGEDNYIIKSGRIVKISYKDGSVIIKWR